MDLHYIPPPENGEETDEQWQTRHSLISRYEQMLGSEKYYLASIDKTLRWFKGLAMVYLALSLFAVVVYIMAYGLPRL